MFDLLQNDQIYPLTPQSGGFQGPLEVCMDSPAYGDVLLPPDMQQAVVSIVLHWQWTPAELL